MTTRPSPLSNSSDGTKGAELPSWPMIFLAPTLLLILGAVISFIKMVL